MSSLDELHQAVVAAPDDPSPRRAYAAAVRATDPERGKLIDLQLELRERLRRGETPTPDELDAPRRLITDRGRRWTGALWKQVDYFMFWGGFVEEIELDAAKLIADGAALARTAPLRHLRVRKLAGHVTTVAAMPLLSQIRSLDVASCWLRDVDVAELVASPHLRKLRLLRIANNPDVTIDALRAIARADLAELQYVEAYATDAPLVHETSDWDGSIREVHWTRIRSRLVEELGHLPWLDSQQEPPFAAI
jgi:hypothetical protein